MKNIHIHRVGTLRGLLETILIGGVCLLGLLSLVKQLPQNALSLGIMYIGAGTAFWYSIRLKIPVGTLWRKIAFELINTAALGLAMLLCLPLLASIFGFWERSIGSVFPGFDLLFILAGCMPAFVGLRVLNYGWFFWDRLRKSKLIWEMVHTQLSVVVVIVMLVAIVGAIGITFEANTNFPEETLAATFAHRIVLTILPFFAVATVGTAFILIVILPPAALASYLFSRRIAQRLEALTQASGAIRQGDYAARVSVSGADEIAQLQNDFNAMAADLETTLADLQSERDKVTALLEARRQLTANVSHELRTPLATLRGYLDPAIENQQRPSHEDLAVIGRETQRLERLVEDLFTLSQAEVEQLTLQTQPTDVNAVVQHLVETYAPLAWQRGRVEVVSQLESEDTKAQVDEGRLEQIIANLLRNAIRHTPPGGIVAVVPSEEDDWIQVEVCDTGEGIPPEDLPHIWERFFRGSDGQPSEEIGAGLGLALVKELTEAMGGMVAVESTLGEGSVFTVKLPLAE
jgi:signal transduction histidine kinase